MDNTAEATGLIRRIMSDLYHLEKLVGEPKTPIEPEKRPERASAGPFEVFWGLYPRKVGKQAALKAWMVHVKGPMSVTVIEALKGQLGQKDWVKDGGQFIPHPQTWLNQHRWEDEVKGGASNDAGKYGGLGETL